MIDGLASREVRKAASKRLARLPSAVSLAAGLYGQNTADGSLANRFEAAFLTSREAKPSIIST